MTQYLDIAMRAWHGCSQLRQRRRRYKDFTYGRQWGDMIPDPMGNEVSEYRYARNSGILPLTNNVIRQLVKCVVGNFRASLAAGDPVADTAPDPDTITRNSLTELDCRTLEEFLISGCAIQRVAPQKRIGGSGVWVDMVSPDSFFVNHHTDPRGLDIEVIGQIHRMSRRELLMRFRHRVSDPRIITDLFDHPGSEIIPTFTDSEGGTRRRIIELWTLESRNILKCHDTRTGSYFMADPAQAPSIPADIRALERTTMRWHCRFLTADGALLDEFDSPYSHGMHPYAIKLYPLIDGEVHSFVEDIIDQQKYINRLITMIDNMMAVSAKGVLLYPLDQKPDGFKWEDIMRLWSCSGAIIPYRTGSREPPRQVYANPEASGAYNLLNTQMQLLQQISGVSSALQGHLDTGVNSAHLYDAQTRQSSVALMDLTEAFNDFRRKRNLLIRDS